MSQVCDSKPLREEFVNIVKDKLFKNCNFEINYPPAQTLQESWEKTKGVSTLQGKNLGTCFSKREQKTQCYCGDPKKSAEVRRRNFIKKLKHIYKIDVEDFNENVLNEIIMKVKLIEKEKRERRQRNMDRTMTMVGRLLEDQKCRTRVSRVESSLPKILKRLQIKESICIETKIAEEREYRLSIISKNSSENQIAEDKDLYNVLALSKEEEEEEEEGEREEKPLTCLEIIKRRKKSAPKMFVRKLPPCIAFEKQLECTPQRVVFQDYKKNKVYLQELKITNIGLETIHCRYLGILVHVKGEGKFPIGVAVRDNVKLRPGLCCSTKIRLCSPDDDKEMECSIVYETRRQKKNNEHCWFFVPVSCIPARAIVKVTPLKIIFPTLNWCEATSAENASQLTKILKIENMGGKGCVCKISDKSRKEVFFNEFGEHGEGGNLNLFSPICGSNLSQETSTENGASPREEFYGENYFVPYAESEETAEVLVNELIENDFSTFRFSQKYCIEIPPFSVRQIEVRFIPKYKGFHHEMKYVQFEGCYNVDEQTIELMGDIKQIPLRVEPNLVDLKTCTINSGVYAGIFRVHNCRRVPFHVRLKIPPSLKKHAHVYPRSTIIQPRNCCAFSVKIYPRVTLSEDAPRYYDENSGILEFPVRVHPAKDEDCRQEYLEIYVHALITTYDLELSPAFINFETITTQETVRTQITLTNHSLVVQEYAFLNLPKGVRVEPNMGFGMILPMETITLYLLFSPVADLCPEVFGEQEVEFCVTVTSIAEFGGFREKLKEEISRQSEWQDNERDYKSYEYTGEFSPVNSGEAHSNEEFQEHEESSDSDFCEDFSIEGEELTSKILQKENQIRNFLQTKDDAFKKVRSQSENQKGETPTTLSIIGEYGEIENYEKPPRANRNMLKCCAKVIIPRCQMSETVIQLPATPYKCYSLYRIKLIAVSDSANPECKCGLKLAGKDSEFGWKFTSRFEFLNSDPQIKVEPGSGYLKPGDCMPVTIIFRPEVEEPESRMSIVSDFPDGIREKFGEHNPVGLKSSINTKIKNRESKVRKRMEGGDSSEFKTPSQSHLRNEDSLESTSAPDMAEPVLIEAKIRCVIKTLPHGDEREMTETHDLILICPAIRRDFNHLGNTEEIHFGKLPVGTRSQIILQFQNISSERLSPHFTLLNPAGPFICPGNFNNVEVDPEHIWRQPVTFAPEEGKMDSQFFEVILGHTTMILKLTGEAVEPRCEIQPSFRYCLLETKPGTMEEIKVEIINLSPVELLLQMETAYVKEGTDLQTDAEAEDVKDKKKKYRLWEKPPEVMMTCLESFEESSANVFTLVGVDGGNNFVVPSNEANQIKIQFWGPSEKSDKIYAAKYNVTLGKRIFLKEMIILGRILK